MTDCKFVTAVLTNTTTTDYPRDIPDFLLPTEDTSMYNNDGDGDGGVSLLPQRRGYGFYFFEDPNDNVCYWVSTNQYDGNALDEYFVFLGSEWLAPRATASLACGIAVLVTFWLCTWSCIAHIRVFRILVLVLVWCILVPFQISALAVLNSEFCTAFDCQMNRAGWFAIVAFGMFFLAGICLCFTRSYDEDKPPYVTTRGDVGGEDEEEDGDVELHQVMDGRSTEAWPTEDMHNGIGDAEEIQPVPVDNLTVLGAAVLPPTAVPVMTTSGSHRTEEDAEGNENGVSRANDGEGQSIIPAAVAIVVEDDRGTCSNATATVPMVAAKHIQD
jgi:hypothetical protein